MKTPKYIILIFALCASLHGFSQHTLNLKLKDQYLHFPVSYEGEDAVRLQLKVDNEVVREFDIFLPDAEPDFWVWLDISAFRNQKAVLKTKYGESKKGLDLVYQSNERPYLENVYQESLRPQVHFSSMRGWNNDPNGLVYYDGEYHLFYQHNPYGWNWGNMHWGHAVSTDLLHWEQLPEALYPDEVGVAYSGCALIDYNNTSGFQEGDEPPMIAVYTSTYIPDEKEEAAGQDAMERQSIAYSDDRGRSWTTYEGNPVIGDREEVLGTGNDRDPNVFWHEPTKKWVMILFERIGMSIWTSDNLKEWNQESHFETFWECPELFELPVDGDPDNTRWVVYGAGGYYMIGSFDGKEFKPENGPYHYVLGEMYAAQTYENIPEEDGRQIQIGWGTISTPGMPFNMMMTFPTELTLRTTSDGIRMFNEPVSELASLHKRSYTWDQVDVEEANKQLEKIDSELLHATFEVENINSIRYSIQFGVDELTYNISRNHFIFNDEKQVFRYSPELGNKSIRYEVILDRTSIEVFVDNGRFTMVFPRNQESENPILQFEAADEIKINSLEVFELNSIWH